MKNWISDNIKENPKQFWSYVRSKLKTKPTTTKVINKEGNITESDVDSANEINSYLTTVFVKDEDVELPPFLNRAPHVKLTNVEITESIILKTIQKQITTKIGRTAPEIYTRDNTRDNPTIEHYI